LAADESFYVLFLASIIPGSKLKLAFARSIAMRRANASAKSYLLQQSIVVSRLWQVLR
jgi:hypothetical protein